MRFSAFLDISTERCATPRGLREHSTPATRTGCDYRLLDGLQHLSGTNDVRGRMSVVRAARGRTRIVASFGPNPPAHSRDRRRRSTRTPLCPCHRRPQMPGYLHPGAPHRTPLLPVRSESFALISLQPPQNFPRKYSNIVRASSSTRQLRTVIGGPHLGLRQHVDPKVPVSRSLQCNRMVSEVSGVTYHSRRRRASRDLFLLPIGKAEPSGGAARSSQLAAVLASREGAARFDRGLPTSPGPPPADEGRRRQCPSAPSVRAH